MVSMNEEFNFIVINLSLNLYRQPCAVSGFGTGQHS